MGSASLQERIEQPVQEIENAFESCIEKYKPSVDRYKPAAAVPPNFASFN